MNNYQCPFNYIGGKSKLLSQIFSKLTNEEYDNFFDVFAGGFSVGINSKAKNVFYNDINIYMTKLIEYFYKQDLSIFLSEIETRIMHYNLSKTNKEAYLILREKFNREHDILDFYLLICYSFNHQIRFNQKGDFNTPFGYNRSYFSDKMKNKLINFIEKLKQKNILFTTLSFENINIENYPDDTIFFCDPPYLITCGSYNDGKRGISFWNEELEKKLLLFLDEINNSGRKFILTNILFSGKKTNSILDEWKNKYNFTFITSDYSNSNYQKKKIYQQEIIVTNFLK